MPSETNIGSTTDLSDLSDLTTVPALSRESGGTLTEPAIRWFLFNRDTNGLSASGAVVKVGRRLFLRRSRFAGWLSSQVERPAA